MAGTPLAEGRVVREGAPPAPDVVDLAGRKLDPADTLLAAALVREARGMVARSLPGG